MLGEVLARTFHGLIADMRNAMYLDEVPGQPVVREAKGRVGLNFPLGESAVLEVEPVGAAVLDGATWGTVHRVKLFRIIANGEVLL